MIIKSIGIISRVCLIEKNECELLSKLLNAVDSETSSDSELVKLYTSEAINHILQQYDYMNYMGRDHVSIEFYPEYGWIGNRLLNPDDKVWTTRNRLASELNKEVRCYR